MCNDFLHHAVHVGRLNNGSFGAVPQQVLKAQDRFREEWLRQPDALYFDISNGLDLRLQKVQQNLAGYLGVDWKNISLVENATVATSTVAQRWARLLHQNENMTNKKIMVFNHAYGACKYSLKHHCEPFGGEIVEANLPFPVDDEFEILYEIENTLKKHKPQFCFIDHITSQPSMVLPIQKIVDLCHAHASQSVEIAVDGSHAIGSIHFAEARNPDSSDLSKQHFGNKINLDQLGVDFYFSNLHKWALAPTSATLLYCGDKVNETNHAIISWPYGQGIDAESRWPGTKDFSAYMAIPAALDYLTKWQSTDGRNAIDFNRQECWKYATMLADAWGTSIGVPRHLSGSMTMVKLPESLAVDDKPGMPSKGVRSTLRDAYNLEVAIGNFGKEVGNYIRLSHAIYNTQEEYERLRDAIFELSGIK